MLLMLLMLLLAVVLSVGSLLVEAYPFVIRSSVLRRNPSASASAIFVHGMGRCGRLITCGATSSRLAHNPWRHFPSAQSSSIDRSASALPMT